MKNNVKQKQREQRQHRHLLSYVDDEVPTRGKCSGTENNGNERNFDGRKAKKKKN